MTVPPRGRLTLAILSAVAEIERENIRIQFMSGKMQKVLQGGWAGGRFRMDTGAGRENW